jgi:decaprenylphospho-beta-D-ribofuranose 2-oxidase
VPVTPGTRFVTIAGAIAADVHGKNHHVDGTFSKHVIWLDLIDGTGSLHRLRPSRSPARAHVGVPADERSGGDAEAFWATVGGLGLTGVITRAAVQLRRIESSRMAVDTERVDGLDALMSRLRDHDAHHPYTVAWIDVLSAGRQLGRGVITSGRHATADEVRAAGPRRAGSTRSLAGAGRGATQVLAYRPRRSLPAPALPLSVVNLATARVFNEVWYRKAPRNERGAVMPLEAFFHPLDLVRDWNRLYGPSGFLQYQFVVPDGREDVVRQALEGLHAASTPAFLAVLKRFGAAGCAPLSFPRPGWTLAMDIPAGGGDRLADMLDDLDERVVEAGGSVYLVKDSRCRAEMVQAMYPRLPQWRETRHRLDPDRRFASDLSRRVGL